MIDVEETDILVIVSLLISLTLNNFIPLHSANIVINL